MKRQALPPDDGCFLQCYDCGATSRLDRWVRSPLIGDRPRGTYQCPRCRAAWRRVVAKWTGKVTFERAESTLL